MYNSGEDGGALALVTMALTGGHGQKNGQTCVGHLGGLQEISKS